VKPSSVSFHRSLRGRLLLYLVLPVVVIFSAIIVFSAANSFTVISGYAQRQLESLADEVALEVEEENARATMAAKTMALAQEEGLFGNRAGSSALVRSVIESNPFLTGGSFGYEPNADGQDAAFAGTPAARAIGPAFDPDGRFIPYWYRNEERGGELSLTPLVDMDTSLYYDGARRQFNETNQILPLITEPYVYEGKMIVEHVFPIVRGGRFVGMAAVDRALSDIGNFLSTIAETQQVDVFLVSSRGRFIATTSDSELRTLGIHQSAYSELFDPFYADRTTRQSTVAVDPQDGGTYYFTTAPVPSGDWLVVVRRSEAAVVGPIRNNILRTSGVALAGMLLVVGLAQWLSTSTSRRIRFAMEAADRLAAGDLSEELGDHAQARDEIGHMFRGFERVVDSYRQVSEVCAAIATGDFSRRVPARSERDSLAEAINLMADGREAAEEDVQEYTARIESRAAMESSFSQLNASLRGDLGAEDVAHRGLAAMVDFLKAPAGALFVTQPDQRVHRLAAHAYPENPDLPTSYARGSGMVGQVARSGRAESCDPGPEVLRLAFGFGEEGPGEVLVYPLIANEKVVGVAELCLLAGLTEEQLVWLAQAAESTANALRFSQESDERKQAEERNRLLLECAAEGIFGVDTEGNITFVNTAASGLLGYDIEEMLGQNVHALIQRHRPDGTLYAPEESRIYAAYTRGEESRVDDQLLRIKGGMGLPVELGVTPILKDDTIVGAVFSFRDITERKEAEEQLRAAMEKAETATKAKSDFLANMSHEIRTPMNGIIGMTELALDTELTPEQREYLITVRSSGEALLTLINDILDFSKIEAGKLELDPIDFDLRDSVADILNTISVRAQGKGLELAFSVQSDVHDAVIGDIYRLRQVIMNLVGNAIKFTEEGEIVVEVEAYSQEGGESELHFSVRDTGVGISQEKVAAVFKPFEQADSSTTRRFGGTGLGLAISVQLVELMEGRIWAESEVGVGSTFHFTAKFKQGVVRPQAEQIQRREALQSLRVLVVDDNDTNRRILDETLGIWRMVPHSVPSASEALIAVSRAFHAGQPFQLILSDVNMPDMDGFDLFNELRSGPHRDIPFVLLTSAASPGDVARCREIGVAAHLIKPVKQSLLMNAIANAMDTEAPAQVETAPAPRAETRKEGERILKFLLAEDHAVNQKFATRVIHKAGHEVEVAINGVEVLAAWEGGGFDVILMDIQMPEMDGHEATRRIRERELSMDPPAHIPIIAMTANAMKGDREKCLDAGMDGYVSKPVKRELLFAEIERVLERTGADPEESPGGEEA